MDFNIIAFVEWFAPPVLGLAISAIIYLCLYDIWKNKIRRSPRPRRNSTSSSPLLTGTGRPVQITNNSNQGNSGNTTQREPSREQCTIEVESGSEPPQASSTARNVAEGGSGNNTQQEPSNTHPNNQDEPTNRPSSASSPGCFAGIFRRKASPSPLIIANRGLSPSSQEHESDEACRLLLDHDSRRVTFIQSTITRPTPQDHSSDTPPRPHQEHNSNGDRLLIHSGECSVHMTRSGSIFLDPALPPQQEHNSNGRQLPKHGDRRRSNATRSSTNRHIPETPPAGTKQPPVNELDLNGASQLQQDVRIETYHQTSEVTPTAPPHPPHEELGFNGDRHLLQAHFNNIRPGTGRYSPDNTSIPCETPPPPYQKHDIYITRDLLLDDEDDDNIPEITTTRTDTPPPPYPENDFYIGRRHLLEDHDNNIRPGTTSYSQDITTTRTESPPPPYHEISFNDVLPNISNPIEDAPPSYEEIFGCIFENTGPMRNSNRTN